MREAVLADVAGAKAALLVATPSHQSAVTRGHSGVISPRADLHDAVHTIGVRWVRDEHESVQGDAWHRN